MLQFQTVVYQQAKSNCSASVEPSWSRARSSSLMKLLPTSMPGTMKVSISSFKASSEKVQSWLLLTGYLLWSDLIGLWWWKEENWWSLALLLSSRRNILFIKWQQTKKRCWNDRIWYDMFNFKESFRFLVLSPSKRSCWSSLFHCTSLQKFEQAFGGSYFFRTPDKNCSNIFSDVFRIEIHYCLVRVGRRKKASFRFEI